MNSQVTAERAPYDNILNVIGRTPLVRINKLFPRSDLNIYAKCEFLNPGGSVKDRVGYQMVIDAQQAGRIKPGDTLIEPTSGNTGIGIALAGAVLGYNVIITMPEKMSQEKQSLLEALGAKIIRTPTELPSEDPNSHIGVAARLARELPRAHVLDQYANLSNPQAHYVQTAQEIIDDLGGHAPDYFVATAGTGGTISGASKRLKEQNPNCCVIGCDPVGSILAGDGPICSYKVEGIGYDFIPKVLDRGLVDEWVKTNDADSFLWARRAIRQEGLLCGGSSGAALYAVHKKLENFKAHSTIVVILSDGVRNYMSKMMSEEWLKRSGFEQAIHG